MKGSKDGNNIYIYIYYIIYIYIYIIAHEKQHIGLFFFHGDTNAH